MKPQNSSRIHRFFRSLYFLLDRLQVSRSERLAVSFMALVLVVLSLLNMMTHRRPDYDPVEYENLEQLFREKAASSDDTLSVPGDSTDVVDKNDMGSDGITDSTAADTTLSEQKININTASAEVLQELPGIGPTYSRRIVNWRVQNGPFTSPEQLLEINGIGPVRLRRLSPLIGF